MKSKIIALTISLCMIVAVCVGLCACSPSEQQAQAYVSLDINPSVELTLDSNDKVISVRGANEDGQVLLYGETSVVGLKVDEAVAKITELAVQYGYLGEDNKVVQTNVVADKRSESILSNINAKVSATAESLNVSVSCQGVDEAYSLARKLDNLKKQYPESQAIQNLTPSKFKLVVSASETGEISIEAAAELDTSKLVAIVSDAHEQMKDYATIAYNEAKATAEGVFAKAKSTAIDSIYTTYFTVHHPIDAYYAAAYQGYKVGAVSMNALSDVLFYAEQTRDYPLNEEQIKAVAEALGLGNNVDALKNSQGEITIRSIEEYADKMFKNSDAAAALAEVKAKLTEALNTAENAIRQKIAELSEKYQEQIEQVKETLTSAAEAIKKIESIVPAEIKSQITSMINDLSDIADKVAAIVSDGKITSDEVRVLARDLDSKSQSTFKIIESKLTDEEKAEIAELQEKAEATLSNAKTQMDKAIAQAEEQAKAYLQQLKDKRVSE